MQWKKLLDGLRCYNNPLHKLWGSWAALCGLACRNVKVHYRLKESKDIKFWGCKNNNKKKTYNDTSLFKVRRHCFHAFIYCKTHTRAQKVLLMLKGLYCHICFQEVFREKQDPAVQLYPTDKPFLDWTVMCNEKWILYDNWQPSAQWLGRVEAPQHFPKPILYPKTVMVTGSLLPVWSTTAFWIPVKRSHLRNMLSRLMWCTENCNTCSWSTRRTRFFCVTVLNHTPHDQHFKSWTNWATKFCLIYHIHLTSRQLIPLLQASQQLFAGKTLP